MQTIEQMEQVAVPLDEWCEFCTMKLATARTADGVAACDGCQKEVLEAMAKYAAEAEEALRPAPSAGRSKVKAQHAKAKAKRRAKRKRTKR